MRRINRKCIFKKRTHPHQHSSYTGEIIWANVLLFFLKVAIALMAPQEKK
jgi:hypothetical protein